MPNKKEYTPEETAIYNEKKQSQIDDLITKIDEGVKAVFESDKYKEYLKFASKFTDYSARNTMLINMQKPESTLVAAYGKWKQLGRQVEKGETGIAILAPVAYKTDQSLEINKPATDELGNQLFNEDGTEKMDTIEKPVTSISFKTIYVFDVVQTTGKDIPDPITELTGDIDSARKEAVFSALKKVTGIDAEFKDIKGGANGFYSAAQNRIVIKSGMSDAQTLKTAFHEAAHNLLHDPQKQIVTAKAPRNEKEVQAESVAFIVAEKFGMDTSEFSFPYIASWSDGKQLDQLKNSLQEIQAAAKKISAEIESELLKLQKRNLSMDEKLTDTDLNNIQKAEFLIEDCNDRGVQFSKDDTDKILDFAGKNADIGETVKLVSDMETIQKQRDSYGYDFTYMTPIDTNEEALEAFDRGEAVYLLYPDNTEGQALDRSEIETFKGYFGIEKEPSDIKREQALDLITVSKDVALEMYDKDLDVYIDGTIAKSYEEIFNVPETAKIHLSEYQYSAQLDFDKTQQGNIEKPKALNPNVIGNTPYYALGKKEDLQFYSNLKNRHASNIAKQLDNDNIKFSGVKTGTVTTITINKADVPAYEMAVTKVKEMYESRKPLAHKPPENIVDNPEKQPDKPKTYTDVPICTQSYVEAKLDNNMEEWRFSLLASKACVKFIDDNLETSYENRDLKGVSSKLEDKFGIDRAMYTVAATVQLKNQDGRFTNEVKDRAGQYSFDSTETKLKFLTECHPVVLNHLYERLIDREKELSLPQPIVENAKLPSIYDDKFLLATEKVELHDDYRGIPETTTTLSSVNQYLVDGKGWFDNSSYDREQKQSGLDTQTFYRQVSKVSATCIDTNGKIETFEMSKQDYELMTDKTYSTENKDAFETVKSKLDIAPKPDEYYAVKQTGDGKYAVCGISADNLVTVVKPHISTIAEAKKAMLEIYEQKKDTVKCNLVHPQTLDEKSQELCKSMNKDLPEVTYRIRLNIDKTATPDNSHVLQQYHKNEDNTYKIGEIICRGDYEKCNKALDNALKGITQTVTKEMTLEEKQEKFCNELVDRLDELSKNPTMDSLDKFSKDALELKINPNVIREACYSLDNDSIDRLPDKYEDMFKKVNTPVVEAPEQDKPKTSKKMKH